MSVQERIRALNIHNNSISGGNTNSGNDILSSSSRRSSPPRGDTSLLSNDTKGDLQNKSPSIKSPESKSHLFKAAKLINKSFDTETDIAQQLTSSPRRGDGSNEDEEELDASAALSTGPRSYKDVLKQSKRSSTSYRKTSEQGRGISSEQVQSSLEEDGEGSKPPSPPDIVRTANTNSDMDQHDTDEMSTANRSPTILEDMPSPTKSVASTSSSGHVRSSSLPQAYARRSRLRSPRGDEQSVASVSSQATSGSTLSARALSKIRDKRKDKQKGGKVSATSKVSNHHTLLEKAKVSKDRIKQRVAKNNGEETKLKTDSPFDEQFSKPQTIDLRPSMPIISSGHPTTISGLNSDVVDPQKYYTHTMDAPQNETAISTVPIKSEVKDFSQKTSVGSTASLGSTLDESTNVTSVLASTEESSTNYLELKATDLFDIARQQKNDIQIKPHQSANPATRETILESPELNAFPIEGCNILEQLNASLESACSALGSATQARNKMFNREEGGLCNKDAPSDEDIAIEDVAIEVEYCEQADEEV